MELTLIIPVFNEAGHLREFFEQLKRVQFPYPVELVIVDDASTDGSWEILQAVQSNLAPFTTQLFRHPQNQGKGAAIHSGIARANGKIIGVQDADFEYDPEDLKKLVEPIRAGKADVVYGSRFTPGAPQVHRTFHYLINRFLTLVSNLFSGLYLTDMETCYKLFRAPLLKALPLESKRFGFEPEVTAWIAKLNVRVFELPVSYFPRNYLQGKKISWKDGIAALWFLVKFNVKSLPEESRVKLPKHMCATGRQWL